MRAPQGGKRVLAFDVRSRSFAFALLEGQQELLDFGVRSFRKGSNAVQVPPREKLAALLHEFNPSLVIHNDSVSRKSKWKLKIGDALLQESQKRRIPIRHITRSMVKRTFERHSENKHEIATVLAQRYPALESKLPSKRKCWQSEDYRMSIFDATALGFAYFARNGTVA
jgi:predicted metal-dependent hydrolase